MAAATDPLLDELLSLARKAASAQALEEKFLEAFSADPDRIDLWLRIAEEMKSTNKREKAGTLLTLTIEHYEKNGTPEHRVKILSFVAGALEKERAHRQSLQRALLDLHGNRPAFDLFLEASGLGAEASVDAALTKLQKMFAYDVGCFVHHATGWGVGLIDGVDMVARELTITFEGQRRHSMPVQSALETLVPLPGDDWRVMKHFKNDELRELASKDPGEVLSRILKQMSRPADVATLRISLEGSVIAPSDWSRWWSSARKAALQRMDVELQGNRVVYRKVSANDRLDSMRKAMTASQALAAANALLKATTDRGAPDSQLMQGLYPLLYDAAAKHAEYDDAAPLQLLLLADEIAEQQNLPRVALDEKLAAHLRDERTFFRRLSLLGNPKLEKRALEKLRVFSGALYGDKLMALAQVASARLLEQIVPEAMDAGRLDELKTLLQDSMRRFDVQPEFLVFARRKVGNARFAALLGELDPKSVVERCLAMGEQVGKKIDPTLRALQRAVAKELSDNNGREFRLLVKTLTLDNARMLMRRIEMLRGLTDHTKMILLSVFGEVHPELAKKEEALPPHLDGTVVYCTPNGIQKRNAEYEHLINVDLPNIFAAVGRAAAFGDLSENAEYTAALEERARLTKKAEEMVEEIRSAKPIDATLLEEGVVTIGSYAKVREVGAGRERKFTFLGPWDADLDKGQLDYRAQLAQAMMGQIVGAKVGAEFGGKPVEFEILEIGPAKLD